MTCNVDINLRQGYLKGLIIIKNAYIILLLDSVPVTNTKSNVNTFKLHL